MPKAIPAVVSLSTALSPGAGTPGLDRVWPSGIAGTLGDETDPSGVGT